MKNVIFLFLLLFTILMSCSKETELKDVSGSQDQVELRGCSETIHCSDFPPFTSINSCDLDLTSFEFEFFNVVYDSQNVLEMHLRMGSKDGWTVAYDNNIGPLDSDVHLYDHNGQEVTGLFNQIIIECGSFIEFSLYAMLPDSTSGYCTYFLICDEECCDINCCDGTSISYKKVFSNEFCCTYDITVSNQKDCINTLWIGKTFHQDIAPFTTETITKEFCRSIQVSIVDEDNNICYKDLIDCTCCSLLDVNIESRGRNEDETCCFYTVWLTNLGECEISVNDKFGNPIITLSPGETDSTYQRACDGKDSEYQVFVTNELEACQLITLPGNCE